MTSSSVLSKILIEASRGREARALWHLGRKNFPPRAATAAGWVRQRARKRLRGVLQNSYTRPFQCKTPRIRSPAKNCKVCCGRELAISGSPKSGEVLQNDPWRPKAKPREAGSVVGGFRATRHSPWFGDRWFATPTIRGTPAGRRCPAAERQPQRISGSIEFAFLRFRSTL